MRKKSCTFAAESCRSGRTGQTRNLLNPSGFRGFESLTFRSPSIKGSEVVLHSLLIRRTFGDSSLSQEWTDNQNKVLRCRALIDGLQGRSRQRKGYPIPHLHSKERKEKRPLRSNAFSLARTLAAAKGISNPPLSAEVSMSIRISNLRR